MGILTQAGNDMIYGNEEDKADATEWIQSDDNCFMSFNWYCRMLDMDPDAMKEGIADNIKNGRVWTKMRLIKTRHPTFRRGERTCVAGEKNRR